MEKTVQLQDYEQRGTLYIIEEKLDRATKDHYKKIMLKSKDKQLITEEKYSNLISRLDEGWVIMDALYYSENYLSIMDKYERIIRDQPLKRCRIVKANCIYHLNYGIATIDFDYMRGEILPNWKNDLLLRLKTLLLRFVSRLACEVSIYY